MPEQNAFSFASETSLSSETFRTIHYLGSKLRILDFIQDVIGEVAPPKSGVCDLFSGSGSVSQRLSIERKVAAVDIQEYSHVINSALLKPISDEFINEVVRNLKHSGIIDSKIEKLKSIIDLEERLLSGASDLESVCNFIENCSLYAAIEKNPKNANKDLQDALSDAISAINGQEESSFLAVIYFGGLYFSYKQSAIIDAIIDTIKNSPEKYRNTLMAALLSTASDIVNTVGKQFAQPIRPRNKNGTPKPGLLKNLNKDRHLDVLEIYSNWLKKYSTRKVSPFNHQVIKADYKDALERIDDDIKVVYADPPYTRDHYSRFYHGLETLCLYDFPKISKTNIGGEERLSRGLYREERHQSDFCIKSKAPEAFKYLFKKVSESQKILLLSYSPYDKSKGSHPRVVELDFLEKLALQYFDNVEVRSPGTFSHSKLNRSDLHLEAGTSSEVLLVCRNKNVSKA